MATWLNVTGLLIVVLAVLRAVNALIAPDIVVFLTVDLGSRFENAVASLLVGGALALPFFALAGILRRLARMEDALTLVDARAYRIERRTVGGDAEQRGAAERVKPPRP
jgi:hypothetical protein